jgi:putative nucleotidyltransferase with HDIG domain
MSLLTTSSVGNGTNGAGLPPELQAVMSRVTEISSLPEITTRIVQVVEDTKSTAQDMHEVVRNDPALASKILKVVNTAFYGLPAQIGSLDRAIVMLGLSAVKNIALAASLARLFRPGTISERFSARDLWTHCIAVGVCSRLMAEKANLPAEEAFVAGLVHDMGLLVEFQLFPDKLKAAVEQSEQTGEPFSAAETRLIGADHQAFGAALAQKWKFPPALRNVIGYHHNPGSLQADVRRFVTLVYVADTICCQNELGFWVSARHQDVTDELLAIIGISEAQIGEVLEILHARIAEAEGILGEPE